MLSNGDINNNKSNKIGRISFDELEWKYIFNKWKRKNFEYIPNLLCSNIIQNSEGKKNVNNNNNSNAKLKNSKIQSKPKIENINFQ